MAKIEFSIGKNPENSLVINNNTVSGAHAKVVIEGDSYKLLDLDSTNGTFVDGNEIHRKNINRNSNIVFGQWKADTDTLFNSIDEFVRNNKLDFSKEFNALEPLFKEYNKKRDNMQYVQKLRPIYIKSGITVSLVVLCLLFVPDPTVKAVATTLVGALGTILSAGTSKESEQREKVVKLEIEYSALLCCPKCKTELIKDSWNIWKYRGACPKCNCNFK